MSSSSTRVPNELTQYMCSGKNTHEMYGPRSATRRSTLSEREKKKNRSVPIVSRRQMVGLVTKENFRQSFYEKNSGFHKINGMELSKCDVAGLAVAVRLIMAPKNVLF